MNKLQLTATLYGTETGNLKERHQVEPTVIHTDGVVLAPGAGRMSLPFTKQVKKVKH